MTVGTAKQESISAGPYNVSFNLSTADPYYIKILQPAAKETYSGMPYTEYDIEINDTIPLKPGLNINRLVSIDISHFQGQEGFNAGDIARSLEPYRAFITLYNRTIDDKAGFLEVISIMGVNKFSFGYSLDSQTVVAVSSMFPWEEGTMDLVKTFHVEEVLRNDIEA